VIESENDRVSYSIRIKWHQQLRDCTDASEQSSLAPGHSARLTLPSLVIVPAQMQHSVNEQYDQLVLSGLLVLTGLAEGLRERNDNVTQKVRRRPRSLSRRKGQHIRGFIAMTKPSIQSSHPAITHEFKAEERVGFINRVENMSSDFG
jgi:hypothetical protein